MRKTAILGALLIVLALPAIAYAATPKIIQIFPSLSFSGTTAKCAVTVYADNSSDAIFAELKLWEEDTCLATWTKSSNGYMNFTTTETVMQGNAYKLTAEVTINGVTRPILSVSGICK